MVTCTCPGIAKGTLDQSVWLLTSEARREEIIIVSETGSRCDRLADFPCKRDSLRLLL